MLLFAESRQTDLLLLYIYIYFNLRIPMLLENDYMTNRNYKKAITGK